MSTALIIGGSRGIGLEFVTQYLKDGWRVIATCRAEADRVSLREKGAEVHVVDVLDPNSLAGMCWQLDDEQVDVCILNAGVYGPRNSSLGSTPSDEEFDQVMRTNVLSAMRMVPALAPMLKRTHGTMAFVSSRMGSITEVNGSYGLAYRVSKAALNMVARCTHAEFHPQGLRVLCLHPGWVRTDMGGPNAEIDAQTSVQGLRSVIENVKEYPGGSFVDYRGQLLPW